jgi:hypothetical protein
MTHLGARSPSSSSLILRGGGFMNDQFKVGLAVLVLFSRLIAPVFAGPLEDAQRAYSDGDYATALGLYGLPLV